MQDEYGQTALHTTSAEGHIDIARYLVEKGANVNILSKVIYTVVCISVVKMVYICMVITVFESLIQVELWAIIKCT